MALATLTIDINAKLANIERDLGRVAHLSEQAGNRMSKSFDAARASMIALGAVAAGGAFASIIKASIDAADNMNDLSQKTGIAVEDLAGLQLVAEQSGTTLEDLAKASQKLSKYMVENAGAMRAAGISATDTKGALMQIADQFAAMPDGPQKIAIALELMGKSGAEMIPTLNQGGQAIAELIAKGQELNPVTAEMAKKADEFNDKMATLSASTRGLAMAIADPLLPALDSMAGRLAQAFDGGVVQGFTSRWSAAFTGLLIGYNEFLAAISEAQAKLPFGDAYQAGHMKNAADYRANISRMWGDLAKLAPSSASATTYTPSTAPGSLTSLTGPTAKAGKSGSGRTKSTAVDMTDYVDPFEGFDDAMRQKAELERLSDRYQNVADPMKAFRDQFAEINRLREAFPELADTWNKAEAAIAEDVLAAQDKFAGLNDEVDRGKDIARDLGLSFSSAFEDAIVGGKGLSDVLKALEQDIARIIIRRSITEPLAGAVSAMIGGLFGGGRASGGPVSPGQYYVVGENGPEVLVPNSAGTVIPNHALGGGGTSVVINAPIDARGADASVLPRITAALGELEARIYRNVPGIVSRQQLRNRITPMGAY